MTAKPHQNDFESGVDPLERLRWERTEVKAEIQRLQMREEELIRQEDKLVFEREVTQQRCLVRTEFLLRYLDVSRASFDRLIRNKAKGTPTPVIGIDGIKRWKLSDWDEWLERSKRP